MTGGDTFLRTEYKYRLSKEELETFMERAISRLVPDVYHAYTVYNVYLDSPDDRMIIRALEHPEYKEKLRIRSYSEPEADTPVFLEIKKKYDGLTGKRRVVLDEKKVTDWILNGIRPDLSGQNSAEIEYALRQYRPVPKIFAAYDRVCWASVSEDDVRVTYDTNIRYRSENAGLHPDGSERTLLPEDTFLLEIKASGRCPMWLTGILSDMKLRRASFSKYGSIYSSIRKDKTSRGMIYRPELTVSGTERRLIHV